MARLTAILLLAYAACLLSWTARGVEIDGVKVVKMLPDPNFNQPFAVRDVKFYRAKTDADKDCMVVSGTVVSRSTAKSPTELAVVVLVMYLQPTGALEPFITINARVTVPAGGETKFFGIGKSPNSNVDHMKYPWTATVTPLPPPGGDFRQKAPPKHSPLD